MSRPSVCEIKFKPRNEWVTSNSAVLSIYKLHLRTLLEHYNTMLLLYYSSISRSLIRTLLSEIHVKAYDLI